MNTSDFARLKLFITGPTMIREEVRQAATLPEFGHRDAENVKRCGPIMEHLRTLAGVNDEYEVCLINGSGSTALEASIRSLVHDDETVLNFSVGAFGDLYHNIALANGKNAVQVRFENGCGMNEDRVRAAMEEHSPAVVTMTHNETSTGVANDFGTFCDIVREYGALPLVDGISIFGGTAIDLPKTRPAMYIGSTQKCLALSAGFGIVFIAPEAVAKAETVPMRGYSSDILRQLVPARKNQMLTTPNTTLLNQLAVQLDYIVNEEGVKARFDRHAAMRGQVHAWVEQLDGFELFAEAGVRSPVMTTVRAPESIGFDTIKVDLKERMRARGYLFDPGYSKLNVKMQEAGDRPIFRVGHMGDITPDLLAEYLDELGEELARL